MKNIPTTRALLATLFLVAVGIMVLLTNVSKVHGQTDPTATAVIATSTATQISQQSDETLEKTYQQVLETSNRAIEEVHQTANNVLNLVGVIFVALTLGGVGGAWLVAEFAKRASDRASVAQQKAFEALDSIQRIESKTLEVERRNDAAIIVAGELSQRQDDLLAQIENAHASLHALANEMNQIRSDRKELKRPLTLMLIDDYGMQLLGGHTEEKNNSITALIEMSGRSDSVVRRRSVKTLGILEEYDERVATRLKEIIGSDTAHGVRKEAEKSLRLIEAKKPKRPIRGKS